MINLRWRTWDRECERLDEKNEEGEKNKYIFNVDIKQVV